jgi:hypothetical protein
VKTVKAALGAALRRETQRGKVWKTMKNRQTILLYLLAVGLVLCGLLALWLPNRIPPDTDPNAPFQDLSDREKEKVLKAIEEYWEMSSQARPGKVLWYEKRSYKHIENDDDRWDYYHAHTFGVRYYGTFNGYHIVMSPVDTRPAGRYTITIADCSFVYYASYFEIFAYRNGVAVPLRDVCESGMLDEEEIKMIYQCFEQYNKEIYTIGVGE